MTLVRCQRPFGSDSSGYYPLFVSSSVNGLLQINCGNSLLYYFAVLGPFFAWQTGLCSYPQSFFAQNHKSHFDFDIAGLNTCSFTAPPLWVGGGVADPIKHALPRTGLQAYMIAIGLTAVRPVRSYVRKSAGNNWTRRIPPFKVTHGHLK